MILARTKVGWSVQTGDTLIHKRTGLKYTLLGREGNVLLVRPFHGPAPHCVLAKWRKEREAGANIQRRHPSEFNIASNPVSK